MVGVDHIVTSGTFSLDGGTWNVDNNVWLLGDDSECVVLESTTIDTERPHLPDWIARGH